ncbi:MAG: hypothetical protein PSX37_12555, partial [bacterium]|nr:hypothetical protein [bacterium]
MLHSATHFGARSVLACLAWAAALTNAHAQPVSITANATVAPADTFITPTAGGPSVPLRTAQITVSNAATLTISGQHHIASLTLSGNSRARHEPAIIIDTPTGPIYGLELTVDGNVTIEAGSGFDVTGLGYSAGSGPGRGQDAPDPYRGGGGGYGGAGARSVPSSAANTPRFDSGPAYGSFREPRDFGSPGGASLGGTILGGAGGGCLRLIVSGEFNLNGFIRCDGAVAVNGASGSGGSVWISATTLSGNAAIIAQGGQSYITGGGGRIAIRATVLQLNTANLLASATSGGGDSGTVYIEAGNNRPLLRLAGYGLIDRSTQTPRPLTIDLPEGRVEIDRAMVVGSTVTIRCAELNVAQDSAIDVSEMGFPQNEGPGRGLALSTGGGGAYGGAGGGRSGGLSNGGRPYGSFSQPIDLGSGGGCTPNAGSQGGAGGGAIRLHVSGLLKLDGELRTNGAYAIGLAGDGSGGSIWVTAGSLLGNGFARANGRGYAGGGRISIEAPTSTFPADHLEARSGFALPGSMYVDVNGERPKLTYDNRETPPRIFEITGSPLDIDLRGGDVEFRGCAITATSVNIL